MREQDGATGTAARGPDESGLSTGEAARVPLPVAAASALAGKDDALRRAGSPGEARAAALPSGARLPALSQLHSNSGATRAARRRRALRLPLRLPLPLPGRDRRYRAMEP